MCNRDFYPADIIFMFKSRSKIICTYSFETPRPLIILHTSNFPSSIIKAVTFVYVYMTVYKSFHSRERFLKFFFSLLTLTFDLLQPFFANRLTFVYYAPLNWYEFLQITLSTENNFDVHQWRSLIYFTRTSQISLLIYFIFF